MKSAVTPILARFIACALAACACCTVALADDVLPKSSKPARKAPAELARQIMEITDAVLEHHVDPPTRQQMILDGVKALYRKAGLPVPQGLSRRISELANSDRIATLLADVYSKIATGTVPAQALDESLTEGLLQSVSGDARLVSAKDRKVEEQFAGNRYVGLHIALGMDEKEKRPKLVEVLEGGPADRAGIKAGDLIEQIDRVDTKGMPLREAVDRLRGDEGTKVTVKVRQPNAQDLRTYAIARGQLPRATVRGLRKQSSGGWDFRLDGPDPIGYMQITDITASTPHELRKLASQLESDGARTLVLDLRGLSTGNLHSTIVVADTLLDHGCIGRVQTAKEETKYEAEPGALFQDWPLAVLIDQSTVGIAEWLAAALQDNHRAVLVGMPSSSALGTPGQGVQSAVSIGDGAWSIILTTGRLERGDGRPLTVEAIRSRALNISPFSAAVDPDEFERFLRSRSAGLSGAARDSAAKSGTAVSKLAVPGADSKYGVKPDHTVVGAPTMFTRHRVQGKDQERTAQSDATLSKAVEILREAMKKS
jgi:carboxyl-terminal processing protease